MEELGKTNVILKEFQESDLEEFYRISREEKIRKFVGFMCPETRAEAKEIVQFLLEPTFICFKIVETKSNKMVGIILGDALTDETVDISYFVGSMYRKKGYCSAAVTLMEKYLHDNYDYKVMRFYIRKDNEKSKNVMRRLGIKEESSNVFIKNIY